VNRTLNTARGPYALKEGAAAERAGGATILTLALERADGIERVVFRCRIANELAAGAAPVDLLARLVPWIEREFEMTRELALKTIRGEQRMLEIAFDAENRGPF